MASRPLQYLTIFLTCFIDILGFGIVIPVLPLYAEHFGATAMQIGWLVGIFSLAQFFFAPIWGKVSDRVGRKPVLLLGLFGTVVGYVLMGLATSVMMLLVARLIDGIAGANIGAAQAILQTYRRPRTARGRWGSLGRPSASDSFLVRRSGDGRASPSTMLPQCLLPPDFP